MRIVQLDNSHDSRYQLSFGIVNKAVRDQMTVKNMYGEPSTINEYWRSRVKNNRIIWRNFNENDDSIS